MLGVTWPPNLTIDEIELVSRRRYLVIKRACGDVSCLIAPSMLVTPYGMSEAHRVIHHHYLQVSGVMWDALKIALGAPWEQEPMKSILDRLT